MFKKFLTALIISVSLFSVNTFAYDDVPNDSPYFHAIEFLRRGGAVPKTKLFKPQNKVTRAEFVKYLVIINSPDFKPQKTGGIDLPFEDANDNAWYAPYFDEALKMGILSDKNKKIRPYEKMNTPNALALLFHSKSVPIPRKHVGKINFKDVARNKRLAPLIMRALQMEIVKPKKADYFGIYQKITRQEAAHMIYRMELVNVAPPNFESKPQSQSQNQDFFLQKIIDSWDLIHKRYLRKGQLNDQKLSDAAIKAMTEAIEDPYSTYLDKTENSSFSDDLDGEIEGIGAMIGFNDAGELTIITPLIDSPAKKAGIKAGDIILKVDGVDIKDLSLSKAVELIKGPKGTKVSITLKRGSRTLTIGVIRDTIHIKALEFEKKGQIMVITLTQFNQNAASEFKKVAQMILGDKEIKGIVIDLRDNPGGLLNVSLDILELFIKKESPLINIKYSTHTQTQIAIKDPLLKDYPVSVLINKGSASASEIVAGALQDYKIATVVGETSFGKGTVQEINFFRDESSLKVTIAEWLTPLKRNIQGNGIKPNIAIQNMDGSSIDRQLNRAIEEVKKKF